MAGALRKTMIYLGLAEGEEVPQAEHAQVQPDPAPRQQAPEVQAAPAPRLAPAPEPAPEPAEETVTEFRAPVTPIKRAAAAPEEDTQLRQITTVHPRSYNDAKTIGESFRDGIPVIMNVTDMGESEAKRLVDFSAGLVFALRGNIERVTNKVFLLTPAGVEILGEDLAGDEQSAFFNQS
ncbi:MAG: cell division protein SepF [Arthrobacter sp.]|jgi:cell division inhibitor SepF|nr:cell division protein SepF [Arthrobacter sp.]